MFDRKVWVQSPSNIALIKYMGKKDSSENIPENSSLSLTLNKLCTYVEMHASTQFKSDRYVEGLPFHSRIPPQSLVEAALSKNGQNRMLAYVERARSKLRIVLGDFGFALNPDFKIEFKSANTFPKGTGIASSASSFSAMTLALAVSMVEDVDQFDELYQSNPSLRGALAAVSRAGSGSSCRSFSGPWVIWEGAVAQKFKYAQFPKLVDLVLVVSEHEKAVSSSEAHQRVKTSPRWGKRTQRVEMRLKRLKEGLVAGDTSTVAQVAWEEAEDMHELFHTSLPSFTYQLPLTLEISNWLLSHPEKPILTLDAGPNLHVLIAEPRADALEKSIRDRFPALKILRDSEGRGARVLEIQSP